MSPQTEESRERKYAALLAELHGESERACAIVGAAWVSDPREAFMRGCATLSNDFEMILFMSGGKVSKGGKVPDSGRVFAEGVDFGNPPATPTSARVS
ncbi:hypothetical protein WKW77_24860 [Variovorax ureilyticus]|uniref:Uncharacterized protein n=1 Tax=Variovorax ureilyticus TaxID=1836198 RepID=A0ABU8VMF1_9BURK